MHKLQFKFLRKAVSLVLGVATLLWSVGFPFANIPIANAVVTGVVLEDRDSTGFGLDGRDFKVTWTPGESAPAGYTATKIFVLANATEVAASTILVNACGGSACVESGFFVQYNQNSFTLPQFTIKDSADTNWNAGTTYKACVFTDATSDELACSSGFSEAYPLTSDAPSDTQAPVIEHIPAHTVIAGGTVKLYAFVFDEQTAVSGFATTAVDGLGPFARLYASGNGGSSYTLVNSTNVSNKLYSFAVGSNLVPAAGETFKYYLHAKDVTGNEKFMCMNTAAVNAAQCQASPFNAVSAVAGSRSVTGTISALSGGSASPLVSAFVFAGGFGDATGFASSAADGTYTLSGLPNNTGFDFVAYKGGHCKNSRFETIGTSNLSAVNMNLNVGDCQFSSGSSGGAPTIVFSSPLDGAFGIPLGENLRIGINQAMNSGTVNDSDASNVGSNIYLTTDDGTTKIAGRVTYCANSSAPGCSGLFSGDQNTILFDPAADLVANTFYTLIVTEGVVSESGQSIQGNRSGGGHKISFMTSGGVMSNETVTGNFGTSGQYMPPFVKSMIPGPGVSAAPNTKILLEFNERMNSSTITTTSVQLWNKTTNAQVILSSANIVLDSTEQRFITISPPTTLTAGEYEVRVKGSVANSSGISLMPPNQASSNAFISFFLVAGSDDVAAPTIYPSVASGSAVEVNAGAFDFGFSEQLDISTVTTSNVTLKRGDTVVTTTVKYKPGENVVSVIPTSALAPNTTYTVTFSTSVTDLSGVALAAATYTYTTGAGDSTAPKLTEARCDDYTCTAFFTEPMNNDTQADSNFAGSVLNHANLTLTSGGADLILAGAALSYDAAQKSVKITGLNLTIGGSFVFTVGSGVKDLSGNAINTTNSANAWNGKIENSANTFGNFGDMGMFGPPIAGGAVGAQFKPEGFGTFTAEQFAFGQADMAFPFNGMASQDSNVFQIRFSAGVALQNDDQVVLTFPTGTGVQSTAPDTFSPFYADMNESGTGTVIFDTALDTDGVSVDAVARKVTVQLAITGTPEANAQYTIDLKNITNPAIPKGPDTGGYTVGIKVLRAGQVLVNKTSMPYFIKEAGSRSITVNIYAGNQSSPDNVSGSVFLFGGGPSGPLNKNIDIVAGSGTLALTSLPDGCYFFGTDPSITLGSNDYFGQQSPEPVCVDSTNSSKTKNIVLSGASAGASASLTVKLAGISDFGGVDMDIFAGGPGRFVVKNLSAVSTPAAAGYTVKIPQNGDWFVGVGPAMPKGASATKIVKQLPGMPPAPVNLNVAGIGGTPTFAMFGTSQGASFDASTNTLTFTFASADKTVTGQVTDGSSGLANVNVFMHAQGFGSVPAFGTTDSLGNFTINVSDYGSYEIGATKDGLAPVFQQIEVKTDGSDAGTSPDLYFKGKQITDANPLVIKLKKGAYSISGKVLDSSGNGISYAPVFASDSDGNTVPGGTDSSGNYTVFVDAGTWTVKSELPPDKTDACGTFSKTVVISTESKSSQNISPSTGTCYTISGTVTVGGSALTSVPLFVNEWDATNSRPASGGLFRPSTTDSSGNYSIKVAGGKTYRIGTFSPSVGEVSITQAVGSANVTGANITVTSGTITFAFTGGTSTMKAFVEVKKDDGTSRLGKQQNGLDSNIALTVPAGTYSYFVDVFGFGKYSGTAATGNTVTINVSETSFVTLSGNVNDGTGTDLAGALVIVKEATSGLITTAVSDSSGNYSLNVKAGTYQVGTAIAGYTPGQAPASLNLSVSNTDYNFGGNNSSQAGLTKADNVIEGTIYESDGSTPMTSGFVTATNTAGLVVTAPVDQQNGSYSLPVTEGSWTIEAKGPRHASTTRSGGAITVSGDVSNTNVTLTADATRVPSGATKSIAANAGGTLDNGDTSGVKLTAGAGVLETGSGNVTVSVEKNFSAPDTTSFNPLGDASFDITAKGTSTIKSLKGNADIEIDYTSLVADLPAGVSESSLKLVYYSSERGEYVPVEGGFTVDTANNKITGQVDHFTTFAVVYSPVASVAASPSVGVTSSGGGPTAPPSTPTQTQTPVQTQTVEPEVKVVQPVVQKPISEMTADELRAKIAEILAAIAQLQAQLALLGENAYEGVPAGFSFKNALKLKISSDEVKYLQIILKKEVPAAYPANVGATGYFGSVTNAALIAFQEKYASDILTPFGLKNGNGYMGQKTKAKLNSLLAK